MKITCVCPVWQRPQRTLRAIESVLAQDFQGYEAIFIGDVDPIFQQRLEDGTFDEYSRRAAEKGNVMIFKNRTERGGGWGHAARKDAIDIATGKYICFLDNDDVLLPNHFTNYYTFMEQNPEVDCGYFNARTEPWKNNRNSALTRGGIGNAELIIKADVLKKEYKLDPEYEHDWRLVDRMLNAKYKFKKSLSSPTYIIMSIPNFRETGID